MEPIEGMWLLTVPTILDIVGFALCVQLELGFKPTVIGCALLAMEYANEQCVRW